MKKALATIMGLAFAVSAMAQYLIYDYNVSFKRVDAQFTKVTYTFGSWDGKKKAEVALDGTVHEHTNYTGYFDSFKTATDKLTGYVLIPKCEDCGGEWTEFGSATYGVPADDANSAFTVSVIDETSYVVVTRNGDNLAKNPYLKEAGYGKVKGKIVWVLQAHIDAAMFGKGAAVRMPESTTSGDVCHPLNDEVALWGDEFDSAVTSMKAAKEAWMVLTYDVPKLKLDKLYNADTDVMASSEGDDSGSGDSGSGDSGDSGDEQSEGVMVFPPVAGFKITKNMKCPVEKIPYGFLGYLCLNGNISNAGFGTVKTIIAKDDTTVGFCGTMVIEGGKCTALNSISGSTIGYFLYKGFCGNAALFDICTAKSMEASEEAEEPAGYAPMAGTFTFKLNSNLTSKMSKEGDFLENFQEYLETKFYTFAETDVELVPTTEEEEEEETQP